MNRLILGAALLFVSGCFYISEEDLAAWRARREGQGPGETAPPDDSVRPDDTAPPESSTWYADADADTFGDPLMFQEAIQAPEGYVADGTDCDDADATVYPDASELCDGTDSDCSDGGAALSLWYTDADGDGYGVEGSCVEALDAPEGYADNTTDCDDADAARSPDSEEVCGDGQDQDCDGEDLTLCWPEGEIAAETADLILVGKNAGGVLGYHTSAGTDVTGDGVPDITAFDSVDGVIYIYSAATTGRVEANAGSAIAAVGVSAGAAYAVHLAGDSDADGEDELVVVDPDGARLYEGPLAGTVDAISGADWALSSESPSAISSGDLDGDGRSEVILGIYNGEATYGAVYIYADPLATGTDTTASADAVVTGTHVALGAGDGPGGAGSAVDSGEDFDGDGLHDLVVGGYGGLSLHLGPVGTSVLTTDAELILTDDPGSPLGLYNALIRDNNGDGYSDLLIGDYTTDAWLFLGHTFDEDAASSLSPEDADVHIASADEDYLGLEVAGPDLDGDGLSDVVLGGHAYFDGDEAAYAFLGPLEAGTLSSEDADNIFTADIGYLGWHGLANAGDVDGSGFDAVAFSQYTSSLGAVEGGAVYLFRAP